jgi:intracellular septation protein A
MKNYLIFFVFFVTFSIKPVIATDDLAQAIKMLAIAITKLEKDVPNATKVVEDCFNLINTNLPQILNDIEFIKQAIPGIETCLYVVTGGIVVSSLICTGKPFIKYYFKKWKKRREDIPLLPK